MKKILLLLASVLVCSAQSGETAALIESAAMPTYLGGGIQLDQFSDTRFKPLIFGATPISKQKGVYGATVADILPVKTTTSAGTTAYLFAMTLRGGVYKTIHTASRYQILIGADGGASFTPAPQSQSQTSLSINLATSITPVFVYQISEQFGLLVPIKAVWVAGLGGWNIVPCIGMVWKPKARP